MRILLILIALFLINVHVAAARGSHSASRASKASSPHTHVGKSFHAVHLKSK